MLKLATDIINLSIDCDDLYRDRIKNRALLSGSAQHAVPDGNDNTSGPAQAKSKCRFAQHLYYPTSSSYAIDCQRYS